VPNGEPIDLTTIVNTPTPTNITLTPGVSPPPPGGTVTINDTGFYQVTYGVRALGTNNSWRLTVNGAAVAGQSLGFDTTGALGATIPILESLTVIVNIAVAGTTLQIVNNSGGAKTLSTAGGAPSCVAAYMTIVKLQ
jgi:hypothetical protein